MAILWDCERLTLQEMITVLEQEQRNWLETASAFERLRPYLSGTLSTQDAEQSAQACRAHVQDLEAMVVKLKAQLRAEMVEGNSADAPPPILQ